MSNMSDLPQTIPTATEDELVRRPERAEPQELVLSAAEEDGLAPDAPRDGSGHPVDPGDRGPDWKEKISEALEYDKEVLAKSWAGFKEGREETAPAEAPKAPSHPSDPQAPKDREPDFVP